MHELLQALEIKVHELVKERQLFLDQKTVLVCRVRDLEASIEKYKEELSAIQNQNHHDSQNVVLASMMVEDIIAHIDQHVVHDQVQS